jgi:hypothetical protein
MRSKKNGKTNPYLEMIFRLEEEAETILRNALKGKADNADVEDMMNVVRYLRSKKREMTKEKHNANYE